jgi:polyphosphate kinase 2
VAKKRSSKPERARIDLQLPTPPKVQRKDYERDLLKLQVELVKMQRWVRDAGQRVVLVFEGRDTAGKGGTIARLREHLNPRFARHVALPVPTDAERGQWYFQRYVQQMPTAGEIVFFDRSWYNRAGVERVMGFATPEQVGRFFRQVVPFESFIVNDGTHLVKIWLEISQSEQQRRLESRRTDPLKQWKISPIDETAPARWDEYTAAMAEMLMMTDATPTPWWFVNNNDKRTGRLNVIRHVLDLLPYDGKDARVAVPPDPAIVRPAREVVASLPARA